jgi:hypothetical protein
VPRWTPIPIVALTGTAGADGADGGLRAQQSNPIQRRGDGCELLPDAEPGAASRAAPAGDAGGVDPLRNDVEMSRRISNFTR